MKRRPIKLIAILFIAGLAMVLPYNPFCSHCQQNEQSVTTYYLKGGFISLEKTPDYAGIQCTQCHGRMNGYIEFHSGTSQIPDASPSVKKNICLLCHTPERDHDFNFERDKKKIH